MKFYFYFFYLYNVLSFPLSTFERLEGGAGIWCIKYVETALDIGIHMLTCFECSAALVIRCSRNGLFMSCVRFCVCLCLCLCLCLSVLYAINIMICRDHTNIFYNITTALDWPYSYNIYNITTASDWPYSSSLRPHTSVCGQATSLCAHKLLVYLQYYDCV